MAAVVRQPFAPLDGARLQTLLSIKNRQNSIPVSSPGKRKAADLGDVDDFENVDPMLLFSKRSKASPDGLSKDFVRPSGFMLIKSSSTPAISNSKDVLNLVYSSPLKATPLRARAMLNPKSPAKRLDTRLSKASTTPLSAPAGRSPSRGNKRIGILNRQRHGAFTRVDPPSFSLSAAPFSLDAAIKGTVPSYASRSSSSTRTISETISDHDIYGSTMKSSWFFEIHEDTPEQEMTNLLQHSTCRLDISSDEECEQKSKREKTESRGKENIPPADDISQTTVRRATAIISDGDMECEKPRTSLGELNVEDFYTDGCDPSEIVIVPADDEDGTIVEGEQPAEQRKNEEDLPGSEADEKVQADIKITLEEEPEGAAGFGEETVKLASLQPVDGTGECFELWESSSAKEDGSRSPSPMPASPASEADEALGAEAW